MLAENHDRLDLEVWIFLPQTFTGLDRRNLLLPLRLFLGHITLISRPLIEALLLYRDEINTLDGLISFEIFLGDLALRLFDFL